MKQKESKSSKVPVVEINRNKYQPSRKELKEKIKIDSTPEQLARLIASPVKIKHID